MSRRLLFLVGCLPVFLGLSSAQCQDKECKVCSLVNEFIVGFDGSEKGFSELCHYSLISSAPIPGLQVLAVLKHRRRLDLSFVDEVILIYGNEKISLRGGRVLSSRAELDLTSGTATVTSQLSLSRDQRFTTVELQHGDNSATLMFNGISAHVRLTGPKGQQLNVDGLCQNTRGDNYTTECEKTYSEPQGSALTLQESGPMCEALNSSSTVFGGRCVSALTTYDDWDALRCAVYEAHYAHEVLKDNSTQRITANNPPNCAVLESCLTHVCGSDEFCGQTQRNSSEITCLCQATVSASYEDTGKIGQLECVSTNTSLFVPDCFLRDRGINYTQLHLQDDSCRGVLDQDTQRVLFYTNTDYTCGTMLKSVNDSMMYENAVVLESDGTVLTAMSCPFSIPDISIDFDMSVTVEDDGNATTIEYSSTALGNYSVVLAAFLDSDHQRPIDQQTRIMLNSPVYFQVLTHGLEHLNPALVLDSCWATSERQANHPQSYYLIQDSCPSDLSVVLVRSGVGTDAEFSFRMFQFVGHTSDIFLHCVLKLCLPHEGSCVPNCSGSSRRRRSSAPHYAASFSITALTWK